MDLQEAREQIVESYILRTKCTIEEAESFDEDVKKSIMAAGRNGAARPRVVTAEILFDEKGQAMTVITRTEQLQRKKGSDVESVIGRQVQFLVEQELAKATPKRRTSSKNKS